MSAGGQGGVVSDRLKDFLGEAGGRRLWEGKGRHRSEIGPLPDAEYFPL